MLFMGASHPYSLRVSLVKSKFHPGNFFSQTVTLCYKSWENASLATLIWVSLRPESTGPYITRNPLYFLTSLQRKVASLSLYYRCYSDRCYDELQSLVPTIQTFTVRTSDHAVFTIANDTYSFRVPLIKSKFNSNCLFQK